MSRVKCFFTSVTVLTISKIATFPGIFLGVATQREGNYFDLGHNLGVLEAGMTGIELCNSLDLVTEGLWDRGFSLAS
jgi:hypothetical protein